MANNLPKKSGRLNYFDKCPGQYLNFYGNPSLDVSYELNAL